MALTLDLSYSESNDNLTFTLTDTAGTYVAIDNPNGWGSATIPVTDIVVSTDTTTSNKYHLILTITITDHNNESTTYDVINLYDLNGGSFTDASDLVFDITSADLKESGVAIGTSSDELPDGLWDINYRLVDNDDHTKTGGVTTTSNYIVSEKVLVYGVVKNDVYDILRQLPTTYECNNCTEDNTLKEADFYMTYLYAIEASSYVAKTEELISMLYTLKNMIINNSNIIW